MQLHVLKLQVQVHVLNNTNFHSTSSANPHRARVPEICRHFVLVCIVDSRFCRTLPPVTVIRKNGRMTRTRKRRRLSSDLTRWPATTSTARRTNQTLYRQQLAGRHRIRLTRHGLPVEWNGARSKTCSRTTRYVALTVYSPTPQITTLRHSGLTYIFNF